MRHRPVANCHVSVVGSDIGDALPHRDCGRGGRQSIEIARKENRIEEDAFLESVS